MERKAEMTTKLVWNIDGPVENWIFPSVNLSLIKDPKITQYCS